MSVIPGDLDTDRQPPMTVPLRHFLVGLAFLLLGAIVGIGVFVGFAPGYVTRVHVHLLLAGWICITIMGAMTQFVPVWSGTQLHSHRLPAVQLWLVVIGLFGFAASLLTGFLAWTPVFGATMVLGFWTFAYNIGRTLWPLPSYDVTERHFGIALGFFLLLTGLGFLLTVDFLRPIFASLPVTRASIVQTHATLAVFGAVLTTILGALYQLATMFTQTELHGIDISLRRFEEFGYPTGVVLLAIGRLLASAPLARVGGVLVVGALVGFSVILGRRLYETQVDWTPMLSRYAVAAPALALWGVLTLPYWMRDPLTRESLFGAPGTTHLLVIGVVGFVVFGTLYHVVPFIIWVHRYSELLGYEPVPMINDLYDDHIAIADFALLTGGTIALVASDWFKPSSMVAALGGVLVLIGVVLFLTNIVEIIREHSPHTLLKILFGTSAPDLDQSSTTMSDTIDGR